jgi:Rrf2 family protein
MGTLAEREGLSRKYLHALLTGLKSAGLVHGVRGAGGGFVLTRDPAEITLAEILRALEGPLSLVDCVDDDRVCDRSEGCTARGVWQELSAAMENVAESVTLGDVIAPGSSFCSKPGAKADGVARERRAHRKAGRSRPSGAASGGQRTGSRSR